MTADVEAEYQKVLGEKAEGDKRIAELTKLLAECEGKPVPGPTPGPSPIVGPTPGPTPGPTVDLSGLLQQATDQIQGLQNDISNLRRQLQDKQDE